MNEPIAITRSLTGSRARRGPTREPVEPGHLPRLGNARTDFLTTGFRAAVCHLRGPAGRRGAGPANPRQRQPRPSWSRTRLRCQHRARPPALDAGRAGGRHGGGRSRRRGAADAKHGAPRTNRSRLRSRSRADVFRRVAAGGIPAAGRGRPLCARDRRPATATAWGEARRSGISLARRCRGRGRRGPGRVDPRRSAVQAGRRAVHHRRLPRDMGHPGKTRPDIRSGRPGSRTARGGRERDDGP